MAVWAFWEMLNASNTDNLQLEYNSRTHHSNMDVYDRVQRADIVQMAVVVANFAYNAAMRPEKLPRKPLPLPATAPKPATRP